MSPRLVRLTGMFLRAVSKSKFKKATKIHKEIGKILSTYKESC